MKKLHCIIWTAMVSVLFFSFIGNTYAGDQRIAKDLGRLYFMVNPLNEVQHPSAVENFININKSLLQTNSPIIQYARILGNKLVMNGLRTLGQADYDNAYGKVLGMGGNMEQARDVSDSLQQGTVDAYMVGQELLWIANVVPKAANGDWSAFTTTGTQSRRTIREIWPLYQSMGMESLLSQFMTQFQPMMEEQITFLALMFIK